MFVFLETSLLAVFAVCLIKKFFFSDDYKENSMKEKISTEEKISTMNTDQPLETKNLDQKIQEKIAQQMDNFVDYLPIPEKNPKVYEFYRRQLACLWLDSDIDYRRDIHDYAQASPEIKTLIDKILAFFVIADGIIVDNLGARFEDDCDDDEQRRVFRVQAMMEDVHASAYATIALAFKRSPQAVIDLVKENIDNQYITEKVKFMLNYRFNSEEKYVRYTAMACAERIFFCTLFAAVFWLRSKNSFDSFIHANQLISRDENIHGEYGAYLVQLELNKMTSEQRQLAIEKIKEIVHQAKEIEERFAEILLPQPIEDFNAEDLKCYARFITDDLLYLLDLPAIYHDQNPFPWLSAINHEQKANHFDSRPGVYTLTSLSNDMNWRKRSGLELDGLDPVTNFAEVEF